MGWFASQAFEIESNHHKQTGRRTSRVMEGLEALHVLYVRQKKTMPPVPTFLRNHQAVIDAFGYWPDFHDSSVLRFCAEGGSIILEVEAGEMSDEVDAQGYFRLTKSHIVGFEFRDIVSTDLEHFIPENLLFELEFSSEEERQRQGIFRVVLDSALGSDLCGEFRARDGAVSFVRLSEPRQNKEKTD